MLRSLPLHELSSRLRSILTDQVLAIMLRNFRQLHLVLLNSGAVGGTTLLIMRAPPLACPSPPTRLGRGAAEGASWARARAGPPSGAGTPWRAT